MARFVGTTLALCFALLTILAGFALSATSVAAEPRSSAKPVLRCSRRSEIETAICKDRTLSELDRRLKVFYRTAMAGAFGNGSNQINAQKRWLERREKSCGKNGAWRNPNKSIVECITGEVDDRLYYLAIATLFVEPRASIAEIKRQYPREAIIYRAIYEYGTIDDAKKRSAVVGATIAPIFDVAEMAPENVPTPQAAAASDRNFSLFLNRVANWANNDATRTAPCVALARRPGLIDSIGFRFDPSSDCEDTTPPTPQFDRLLKTADRTANACAGAGTVIYDTAATEEALQTAIRAHIPAEWEQVGSIYASGEPERSERRFRARRAPDIAAARAEMTAYYISTFKLAPEQARKQARRVVDIAVSFQFQKCA